MSQWQSRQRKVTSTGLSGAAMASTLNSKKCLFSLTVKTQTIRSCLAQQAPAHRDHSVKSAPPTHTLPLREQTRNHLRPSLNQRTGLGLQGVCQSHAGLWASPTSDNNAEGNKIWTTGKCAVVKEHRVFIMLQTSVHSLGSRRMSLESKPI